MSRWSAAPALLAAALLACAEPEPPPVAAPRARPAAAPGVELRDVLLISVDTLRADHMSVYGYRRATTPGLERWFRDAAVYERSYSTEASTSPSVVSFLSGLLPQEHRVRLLYQLLEPEVAILPDLLPAPYQNAAFVSNMVLTDEAIGMAHRFDHYDDFVAQRERYRSIYERNAALTTQAALDWLDAGRDPARPAFVWVHYIDPHGPYHPPDPWRDAFSHEGEVIIDAEWVSDYILEPGMLDGLEYVDRYDEEIAYLDSEVARLLEGYAERHDVDSALVIFTSDHGESMMEHERWFRHMYHVYDELTRVPLLVRGPGVTPRRDARVVSGVDIPPTVLRFAGLEPPGHMPGVDLRTGAGLSDERAVFAEGHNHDVRHRAAVQGRFKWLLSQRDGSNDIFDRRVYDLDADPGERLPLRWPDSGRAPAAGASRLEALASSDPDPGGDPVHHREGRKLAAPKVDPRVTPEQIEALKALGYVE